MAVKPKIQLSEFEVEQIRIARWRCRTDLGYLCREVLGYKDVDDYVHGPIMRTLQQFPKPSRKQFSENDVFNGKGWDYTPILEHIQKLDGKRRRLILCHRGLMKTTINLQAHTIQWILNFPAISIAIFQSNLDKSEMILKEIKNQFKYNEVFRRLFPEHCPQRGIENWGVINAITTCARPKNVFKREPTVMALSIDKQNAGYHMEVLKFSDIVELDNTKTEEGVASIKKAFSLSESLLVAPPYWIDVEGTRYSATELYQDLLEKWWKEKNAGKEPQYDVIVQGCYKLKDPKTGKEQITFTPDTLREDGATPWEYLLDHSGERIPWWTKDAAGAPRFTVEFLKQKQSDNPYDFTCQYLMKPKAAADGEETFNIKNIRPIKLANYLKNVRPLIRQYTIGLDTAFTISERANHSAFVVLAWDAAGRAYVREVVRKKLLPEALVPEIFRLNAKYKPVSFVIEETQFVSGLRMSIESEYERQKLSMMQNRVPWNLEFVKPDNQLKKKERIYNTLQMPFATDQIRLVEPPYDPSDPLYEAEAVDTFEALLRELKDFPLAASDDILDALADQLQKKEYFGRLGPRDPVDVSEDEKFNQMLRSLGVGKERGIPLGTNAFRLW